MEFIIIIVVVVAQLLSSVEEQPTSRKEELYEVLDHAMILHRSTSRYATSAVESEEARELELEMAHLELMGGYLARTCVYEPEKVLWLRSIKGYVSIMRLMRYSDAEIKEALIKRAGPSGADLQRLFDFAGLDGIGHFICQDYMRARLRDGMPAETLKAYIDEMPNDTNDEKGMVSLDI